MGTNEYRKRSRYLREQQCGGLSYAEAVARWDAMNKEASEIAEILLDGDDGIPVMSDGEIRQAVRDYRDVARLI